MSKRKHSNKFSIEKATEMAYYIFQKCEVKKINYLKLLKIMYFCERAQYLFNQKLITNDSFYAMEMGGILSNVYNLLKNKYKKEDSSIWYNLFERKGFDINLKKTKYKIKNLTDSEKFIIDSQTSILKNKTQWEIIQLLHKVCDEWRKIYPEQKIIKNKVKINKKSIKNILA